MAENQVGQEIRAGFAAVGGAFKEAGRRRNMGLVAKQGYVGFKNPDAVAAFHSNPEYVDWICKFVDGEYRFYPPAHKIDKIFALLNEEDKKTEEHIETKDIVETYKKAIADKTKASFVSIKVKDDGICHYQLIVTDIHTGEQSVIQEFRMNFVGQFSKEVLPSIYNQLMGGNPTLDQEKGPDTQKTIFIQSLDAKRMLGISGLNYQQLELIKNMCDYVETLNFPEAKKGISK